MGSPKEPGKLATLISTHGPLSPYVVELLLAERVPLDGERIAGLLRKTSGAIEHKPATRDAFTLAYLGHRTDFAEARAMPMLHLVTYAERDGDSVGREAALEQTWDWPDEARSACKRARAVLSVHDAAGLEPATRLELFQRLVRALVKELPVLAIHWCASQRIVDPAKYIEPIPNNPITQGPVNVRLFRIEGGARDEILMDTLGLAPFLLPDLQCRIAGVPAPKVAAHLFAYAVYVFTKGDVLKQGDTVDGVGEKWRCRDDVSLMAPTRRVIALAPDTPLPSTASPQSVRCPKCGWVPDAFARWECDCGFMWNTFDTRARCPSCDKQHAGTQCPECGRETLHDAWYG